MKINGMASVLESIKYDGKKIEYDQRVDYDNGFDHGPRLLSNDQPKELPRPKNSILE